MQFARIDGEKRRAYERFFFERICSMSIADRRDFTVDLPQVEGLYFTSVQDTVERLMEPSGRLSKFQWRNCIFAPIDNSVRPENAEEVFNQLKSKAPFLFVRSYVYLIFIRLKSYDSLTFKFDEAIQQTAVFPRTSDYKIYYWNTKYEVQENKDRKNLFGDGASGIGNDPRKLFIVENPSGELNRIQDANSDVIDAWRAFNGSLPLVAQTEHYLTEVVRELDNNENARVLVEGPARSGKTILAMSLLARYPKSKMLLMNWYFYDALKDAFKIWAKLSTDEIEQLFAMPQHTKTIVESCSRMHDEFLAFQADPRVLDVALRAIENPDNILRWLQYTNGLPTPLGKRNDEWRAFPVRGSAVGDLVAVIKTMDTGRVMQIVKVRVIHADRSATVEQVSGIPEFTIDQDRTAQLLEYKRQIEAGRGAQYIAKILKDISDALHNSTQRFFHHDIAPDKKEGCWIERGNPTFCRISDQDLVICDEVQRLGVISELLSSFGRLPQIIRDRFDETFAIFRNSRKSFFCGDDFQMLNPIYDRGIGAITRIAAQTPRERITRLELPDSIGVPAEVGELVKYLLNEHRIPERSPGFEILLLHDDDIRFVGLFEADNSTKKHYAIPNNTGFYSNEPYIHRTTTRTRDCTSECVADCKHRRIPMLTKELRLKFKFFCSEAIMPSFALSAYELISREVESVYLKIPAEIDLRVVNRPLANELDTASRERNWRKQHLYVLMTRATMKLVINIEDEKLYKYLSNKLVTVDEGQSGTRTR